MENKVKIAVVSGSTSFIGSGLIEKLVAEQVKVYALCRFGSKNMWRLPKDPLVVLVDYDMESMHTVSLEESCDVFYHLAWSTGEKNDFYLQNKNVTYTLDAIHLAKKLGCTRFLFAGSQAEYGLANVPLSQNTPCFPVTGYGMAKLCAGQMGREEAKKLGIEFLYARILSVYGEKDNPNTLYSYLCRCFQEGISPELTDCTQIWDYLPIEICSAILWKLSMVPHWERIYVIGSGEGKPLKEFVLRLRDRISPDAEILFGVKEQPKQTPSLLMTEDHYCGLDLDLEYEEKRVLYDRTRT